MSQSGGVCTLGLPGYAKKPTGTLAPIKIICCASLSAFSARSTAYGTRPIATRPAPRSMRPFDCCARRRAPVTCAMRSATESAFARKARPERSSTVRLPLRSFAAASRRRSRSTEGRGGAGATLAIGAVVSFHAASAGRISVAIRPGGVLASTIAAAASRRDLIRVTRSLHPMLTSAARASEYQLLAARRIAGDRSRGRRLY